LEKEDKNRGDILLVAFIMAGGSGERFWPLSWVHPFPGGCTFILIPVLSFTDLLSVLAQAIY